MVSARLGSTPSNPIDLSIAWFKRCPWVAVWFVMTIWIVMPEVRRLMDWRLGYNSISIISVVPLVALLPFLIPLAYTNRLKRLDRGFAICTWLWIGGFTFSLAIAFAQMNIFGGAYSYAEFMLPAVLGLWVATCDVNPELLYERVATFLLWSATIAALYGAIQFVVAPEWDMDWMRAANLVNIGVALPFEFRPFSTLNSPGLFADFLAIAVLFNLPRISGSRALVLLQTGLVTGVLVLTMVRSDWLAFAIGLLAYIALSPNRLRNLAMFGGVGILCTVLVLNASTLLGSSDAGKSISARFETFTDLDSDVSYNERQRYFGEVLVEAFETPLGQGLGVLGTAAKLGDKGSTKDFDNGYVARFTEMGYFGTLCYLGTVFGALFLSLRRWWAIRQTSATTLCAMTTGAIAVQIALISLDISSDHHNALPGLFFWLSFALVPAMAMIPAKAAKSPAFSRGAARSPASSR